MGFLYPVFLIGALAVAIPVVLHFLRRDIAPEVPFSAVRLLERSPVARSRRRRLRDLLLLAARVAALVLLAAAFARPYIAGASGSAAIRIVAIDRSFSMGAAGRFAKAVDLARRAVDDASPGQRIAVVVFDDGAKVVAQPGSAAEARAAIENLRPGFGATRYAALFTKAAELAGDGPGRLVVVTDLQQAGLDGEQRSLLPRALEVELKDTGVPAANLALTGVRIAGDGLAVSIHNTGYTARRGEARVARDGRVVATTSYSAQPGTTAEVEIPYRVPSGGSLAVSIDDEDGFPADNERFVVLDPPSRGIVLIVTSGTGDSGFYVARALGATADRADQRLDSRSVASASLAREQDSRKLDLAACSVVVLLSTRALERRAWESLAGFVRNGGGLLIAASPDVDPVVVSTMFDWRPWLDGMVAAAEGVALSPTDVRHPIFRPFGTLTANLGQVRFDRAWRLRGEGWDVVARFTDGNPAMLERHEGRGRVLLFASDLDRRWNDFPLHPVFVPFALEAVSYAAGTQDLGRDYLVGSAPEGAGARPGVYRARDGRAIAVNVDPRESSTAVVRADDLLKTIERVSPSTGPIDARAQQVEARQSYWQYGLMLMLAALVAESFVGRA
jgi:hypothetical protein